MWCKKIQELLKSDYLDGQANQKEEQLVKEHLAGCGLCRKLEEELRAQQALLKNAKRIAVPESLWQNIRQGIASEELSGTRGLLQRLRDYVFRPRPAFVLASALTMIIFITFFFIFAVQKRQFDDAGSDMAVYSLNGESDDSLYSLGTNIEEYFL